MSMCSLQPRSDSQMPLRGLSVRIYSKRESYQNTQIHSPSCFSVTDEKPPNRSPVPGTCRSKSSDADSRRLRKFTASIPRDAAGTICGTVSQRPRPLPRVRRTGGRVCRSRPQCTLPNHRCCFTSLAPVPLPSRCRSLFSSSREMISLHALRTSAPPPHRARHSPRHPRALREPDALPHHVAERLVACRALERRRRELRARQRRPRTPHRAHNHLVHQYPQRPPVHRRRVSVVLDHLGRDVFCTPSAPRPSAARTRSPSVPTNELVRKLPVHVLVSTTTTGTCKSRSAQPPPAATHGAPRSGRSAPASPRSAARRCPTASRGQSRTA